jgi:HSP20 family protein
MLRRFGTFSGPSRLLPDAPSAFSSHTMPLDVIRHEDHVALVFDVPGVDPDDIEVTVDGRELVVRAERDDSVPEGAQRVRSERYLGTLERRVQLGETLDTDQLTAHHEHGVLEIVVPVAASAKPRKVEIGVGSAEATEIES